MGMRVIGIDGGDSKRDLCMKLGCTSFIDFTKTSDVTAELMTITQGRGAKGVFVTATSKSAYELAPSLAGIGGKVMCVGLSMSNFPRS
jgi:alcohol dehydrogenase, propanol-preferring